MQRVLFALASSFTWMQLYRPSAIFPTLDATFACLLFAVSIGIDCCETCNKNSEHTTDRSQKQIQVHISLSALNIGI